MKTKQLLSLVLTICFQNLSAQITFLKQFRDIPDDFYFEARDIKPTSDSGYIFTGFNMQNSQTSYGSFLMKLNINGDTVWTKHYYASSVTGGEFVVPTCDGGFVSMGGAGIFKANSIGDTLWTKSYNGMSVTQGYLTSDCGFILSGATHNFGAGLFDINLIKTDADGIPLWSKTYGGDSSDRPFNLQQTIDGGFIVAGISNSFSNGIENRIYVIKTDSNGDTLWTKSYGFSSSANMGGGYIFQTYDRGYIISGGSCLIKTDTIGNIIWSKSYTGSTKYVLQTYDSGYVFAGSAGSNPGTLLLTKTDNSGNIIWHNTFSPGGYLNSLYSLFQTWDGGFAITGVGVTQQGMWQYYHPFVKKTNINGSACFEQFPSITSSNASIIASPTPSIVTSPSATIISVPALTVTNGEITVFTECTTVGDKEIQPTSSSTIYPSITSKNSSTEIFINEDLNHASVTVFNVMGKAIYSDIVSGKGKTLLLTLNNTLSPGMYFIRIMEGKKIIVKKIVVL